MQSYIKDEYYDRRAKAAPLAESDYCFVLQTKADLQGSKIPFRDYRWVGPFLFQKVLSNENYIFRRLNANKTQILHRIRLKKFVPKQPLQDNCREERLQQHKEIVIPQDDLYTTTWETNFGDQLATGDNEHIPNSLPNGEQTVTSDTNSTEARENEADYIITRGSPNDVNDVAQRQNERMKNDVGNRNEANEDEKNEISDWPDSTVYHNSQEKSFSDLSRGQENNASFLEGNSSNNYNAQDSSKKGDDIIVPEISQSDD